MARATVIGTSIADSALPVRKQRRVFDRGPSLIQSVSKRSEDVLDYFIPMDRFLEPADTVTGASAQSSDEALIVQKVNYAPHGVVVWLLGGEESGQFEVRVQVQTARAQNKLFRLLVLTQGDVLVVFLELDGDGIFVGRETSLQFTPSFAAFLDAVAGSESAAQTITVRNISDATVTIDTISAGDYFDVVHDCDVLGPNSTCSITLTATPPSIGDQGGELEIEGDVDGTVPIIVVAQSPDYPIG